MRDLCAIMEKRPHKTHLYDIHGKQPHNHFRCVVMIQFWFFSAYKSHYLRLKRSILVHLHSSLFQHTSFSKGLICVIHQKTALKPLLPNGSTLHFYQRTLRWRTDTEQITLYIQNRIQSSDQQWSYSIVLPIASIVK